MKQDVWITIRGIQRIDGDRDTTELYTQGSFYRKNGNYYITYEESETTGFAGCRTVLKIEGDQKISLIRHGASRSNLIVEKDARNIGYYGTEEGDLMIGVSTKDIRSALNDEGGELFFSYSLDINASHISDNEVYIDVKKYRETAPQKEDFSKTV